MYRLWVTTLPMASKPRGRRPGSQSAWPGATTQTFCSLRIFATPLTDSKEWLGRVAGTFFDTKTQVDHTRYQHYDIAPSVTWQPNDRTSLTLLSQLRQDPDTGFYNMLPMKGTLVNNPNGHIGTDFYGGQPGFDSYTRRQGSIGYQFRTELNDSVTLRQNVRYDSAQTKATNLLNDTHKTRNDYATTGRAGLLYHFDNSIAPYISYSTSFVPSAGTDFNGNAFKPTKGKQTEVGLKYDPVGLDALFTLALFDLRQTNVATPDPDHVNYSVQTGEIRSRGIELEGKINVTPAWQILASYSLTDPEVLQANDGSEGKHPTGISRNLAKFWSQYAFSGPLDGFSLGGGVRYVGPSYATTDNSLQVPGATVYDARIGWQYRQWQVALNAANLNNKTYLAACQNNGCEYAVKRQYVATLSYQW